MLLLLLKNTLRPKLCVLDDFVVPFSNLCITIELQIVDAQWHAHRAAAARLVKEAADASEAAAAAAAVKGHKKVSLATLSSYKLRITKIEIVPVAGPQATRRTRAHVLPSLSCVVLSALVCWHHTCTATCGSSAATGLTAGHVGL